MMTKNDKDLSPRLTDAWMQAVWYPDSPVLDLAESLLFQQKLYPDDPESDDLRLNIPLQGVDLIIVSPR